MNIKGKLVEIGETQQLTETFQKREFVIEFSENPEYPEFIKFELIKDKCALLDKLNNGDEIDVSFNLKGRKWVDADKNVKYFNSLQAWKIEVVSKQENAAGDVALEDETDDLPW